jgi:regulator of cell morphogenesis and NO signaling
MESNREAPKMKEETQDSREHDNDIRQDTTVGALAVRHPELRQPLETLGLDYCCGGKVPLGVAVTEAGLAWTAVLNTLKEALASGAGARDSADWNNAPLGQLADHILETHHSFMKEQLPRLDGLMSKVQKAHGAQHGDMLDNLRRVFNALRFEIENHLVKEEQILFPAIKDIDAFMSGTGERPVVHCGSIANPIRQMEHEHDSAGNALADMRQITGNYQLPTDACQSFAALYDGLKAMESDLHEHIHLENNILFPKSVRLEEGMNKRQMNTEAEEAPPEPFSPVCYLKEFENE